MSEEGQETVEETPPGSFPVESSSGLVYPVYTNDSVFLLEMRGIMEEWFDFADKVGGGVDEAAAVAAALQTLRSRRFAAERTREASRRRRPAGA